MTKFTVLFATAALFVTAQSICCTVSGDPHWLTFDGVYHDFQAEGVYAQLISRTGPGAIQVQSQFKRCNVGAASPVSCIRKSAVELVGDGDVAARTVVTWGSFGAVGASAPVTRFGLTFGGTTAEPAVTDSVTIAGEDLSSLGCTYAGTVSTCSLAVIKANTISLLSGQYELSWVNGLQIHSVVSSGRGGRSNVVVKMNTYYLSVCLDDAFAVGLANYGGLCGTPDLDATNEFTNFTGGIQRPTTKGLRINDVNMYAWAASYQVGNPSLPSILSSHAHPTLFGVEVQDAPLIDPPTPAVQEQINNLQFATIDDANEAQNLCAKMLDKINDNMAVANCVYDFGAIGIIDKKAAVELAASNAAAANSAEAFDGVQGGGSGNSSSKLSNGAVAGIVIVAVVCGLALVSVMIIYVKLKKTQGQLSMALVAQNTHGAQGSGGIQLQENI